MNYRRLLALAALVVLALPFVAEAGVVIGVGVPGPYYRPYHRPHYYYYYGPRVIVAPPPVVVAPAPVVVPAAPPPVVVQPAPVLVQPAPPVYVSPGR